MNLFSIPAVVGNVDLKKIKLTNEKFDKLWISKTKSSYAGRNVLNKNGKKHLADVFSKLLSEIIYNPFEFYVTGIWENIYNKKDFQEPHVHGNSHFSFIIYKDVKKSNTVFFHPAKNLLQLAHHNLNIFDEQVIPSLKKGQVILFPSYVEHMVLKSTNQKTISGNITVKITGKNSV
tara:strand:- start:2243 stop:2770 length:528 start_codon:yes stop_codon:yes gene_type:complete